MTKCLVIHGQPGHGKTLTSIALSQGLGTEIVHFDEVINVVAEYIREHVGGEKSYMDFKGDCYYPLFRERRDYHGFLNLLRKLIDYDGAAFKKIYETLILGRPPVVDYASGLGLQSLNLGLIGEAMNPFAEEIIDGVFAHIVRDSEYCLLEGYYFDQHSQFRQAAASHCSDIGFLKCCKEGDSSFSYVYGETKYSELTDVMNKLQNPPKEGPRQTA